MYSPLVSITIESIYDGKPLPSRMAHCTPDMFAAVFAVKNDLTAAGSVLLLSDMFRSYDMQLQAHLDYTSGKKKAYSPPPGGSMHEAGRAFDLDIDKIKSLTLKKFWQIADKDGLAPIITKPDINASEAWHFDCRGSHAKVYDYYAAKKADNFKSPYTAMAASSIVSIGVKVDAFGPDPMPAYVQSGLIRLGQEIGDLDGKIGPKTRDALTRLGIDASLSVDLVAAAVDDKLQQAFPDEFFIPGAHVDIGAVPKHIIG